MKTNGSGAATSTGARSLMPARYSSIVLSHKIANGLARSNHARPPLNQRPKPRSLRAHSLPKVESSYQTLVSIGAGFRLQLGRENSASGYLPVSSPLEPLSALTGGSSAPRIYVLASLSEAPVPEDWSLDQFSVSYSRPSPLPASL
jgi:hypothetical protein